MWSGAPMSRVRAIALFAVLVGASCAGMAAQAPAAPTEAAAIPIVVPERLVDPETATFVSALTLIAGAGAGTYMLATSSGKSEIVPGFAVVAGTLVVAPSLGRWIAGDVRTAAVRTGTRVLLVGAASAAAYYGFDQGNGGTNPLGLVVFGLLSPVILAHAITDVGSTGRDLRLARAVEALAFSRTPRGGVVSLTATF